ncbi:hypothetical protein D8Y36_28175, partial [Escherichia coli]
LDSIPQGERSRLNRAALTAGLALYRQDPRAPFLLCELLTKETTFSDIVNILRSLDSIPQGERSRLNRAALTAGLALYRQDPRAPFL